VVGVNQELLETSNSLLLLLVTPIWEDNSHWEDTGLQQNDLYVRWSVQYAMDNTKRKTMSSAILFLHG